MPLFLSILSIFQSKAQAFKLERGKPFFKPQTSGHIFRNEACIKSDIMDTAFLEDDQRTSFSLINKK
ncbi:hypothetical protein DB41_HJ00040 [Neochlamydia sp. TUME1]|nr:hypothetical protein DB41_HJ00040 [Neochlamydia sp. TUME1]